MNWKNLCVQAETFEEAVKKWLNGDTVAKEEKGVNDKPTFTVTVKGKRTIVTTSDGRKGVARCNPVDTFDIVEGVKVAIADLEKKHPKLNDYTVKLLTNLRDIGCDVVFKFSDKINGYRTSNGVQSIIATVKLTDNVVIKPHEYVNIDDIIKK